jgi:type IV fimbrial biogenesis protein FimT
VLRPSSRQGPCPHERGFTIAELLVVLSIIAAFAVAAAPSMVAQLRNGRVADAAQKIADVYRTARARAMGRGSATFARWDQSAAVPTDPYSGHFTVREATMGATGPSPFLPSASCASASTLPVAAFDERRKRYEPATAEFLDPTGSPQPFAELCFTPRGRTFVRFAAAGAFQPLVGVPRIEVINGYDGMRRAIVLPPSGAARVVGKL